MGKKKTERHEIGKYLVIDSEVCSGKLTFKGTRVPVSAVLTALARGDSIDEAIESWPRVSREAILEALQLAAELVAERYDIQGKAA
jgi:uncharacterized protein (DUF433 family)